MKEILELNDHLVRQGALPTDGLTFGRDDLPTEFQALPANTRAEIERLRHRLNSVIPDDFEYVIWLAKEGADFMLRYDNGMMSSAGRGHEWRATEPIIDQLHSLNWDEERKWAIQGSEVFDSIAQIAKELPVMIRPTKALQKDFRGAVENYVKQKRRDLSRVHVLLWEGEERFPDLEFEHLAAFQRALPDLMTHMLQVLAVVSNGKPLPAERIDGLKTKALAELEDMPISHAKASGKFAYIMAAAQQEGGGSV